MSNTQRIRERAEKRMRELLFHAQSSGGTVPRTFSESKLTEELMRFAESELAAEREQCCKDVCIACRTGARLIRTGESDYTHEEGCCVAGAIRSRWQKDENQSA